VTIGLQVHFSSPLWRNVQSEPFLIFGTLGCIVSPRALVRAGARCNKIPNHNHSRGLM
jgi:hypothetical protein